MSKLARNMLTVVCAVLILAAGTVLPDIFIDMKMNSTLNEVKTISAEQIEIYDEDYYSNRQKVLDILKHFRERHKAKTISFDKGASYKDLSEYANGFGKLYKMVDSVDKEIADLMNAVNSRKSIIRFEDGWMLGVIEFEKFNTENGATDDKHEKSGRIFFDINTGLPVRMELYLGKNEYYINTTKKIWPRIIYMYMENTGMSFMESAEYEGFVASNSDSTVSINAAIDHSKKYPLSIELV